MNFLNPLPFSHCFQDPYNFSTKPSYYFCNFLNLDKNLQLMGTTNKKLKISTPPHLLLE